MLVSEIRCDGCDCWGDGASSKHHKPHMLRKGLKARGWVVGLRGGTDLCPDCKPKPKRAGREQPSGKGERLDAEAKRKGRV